MLLRKLLRKVVLSKFIFDKWRATSIPLPKTLWFNLLSFPLKDALKFPLWIYQGTKIEHICKIKLNTLLHTGMIRIGKRQFFRQTPTIIINVGTIEFDGDCSILGRILSMF